MFICDARHLDALILKIWKTRPSTSCCHLLNESCRLESTSEDLLPSEGFLRVLLGNSYLGWLSSCQG